MTDGRCTISSFILCCIFHTVILRSIDEVIQKVETDFEENYDGPVNKFPSRVWYDYALQGRTEELVKLQLDMIMTKDTWNNLIDTDDALPTRNKRNAIKARVRLWPRMIPYHFDERFNISEKYQLLRAMDHWEEHTCLKFVEDSNSHNHDVIEFKPIEYGCESVVGRMQGRQPINLAKACMYKEVIVHEIGHALGLYHEHMRADRDNNVTINYQNIDEHLHPQFDKLRVNQYNDYQKPYDYESIMHYGKLFFSANRSADLLTIVPTDDAYLDIIGEARGLSYYDVKIANELYNCSAGCQEKICPGEGFLGKNCDCYCKGDNSYEVVLCQQRAPCGMPDIDLTTYNVYTPNYEFISLAAETYADETCFIVEHSNYSCGDHFTNFTCKDGAWEGELPACEKDCTVEDLGEDYIQTYNGDIANVGYKIHSRQAVYVMCSYMIDDYDASMEYIYCSDGNWDTRIHDIVCVKEHPYCSMIINSTIKGSFDTGFKITCLGRFELESQEGAIETHEGAIDTHEGAIDSFSCTWTGVWKPYTPVCKPANCKVPEDITGDLYMIGEDIFGGSEVIHGERITYVCPRGHVPDIAKLTCIYGKFDTPGGNLPACMLVTCPDPDVENTTYSPVLTMYQYGDMVNVRRCMDDLEFVGKRTLTCLNDGNWSSTALCRPFCPNGKVEFLPIKNREFVDKVRYKQVGLSSYSACKEKCRRTKRVLCQSFAYGVKNKKLQCRLYMLSAEQYPELTQERSFWTISVRKCYLPD